MATSSYKTFSDLVFKKNHHGKDGQRGTLVLDNGIEVSVVCGKSYYCGEGTYEIAMLAGGEFLPLGEWDDVVGWQTSDQIDALLTEAQEDGELFMDKLDAIRKTQNNAG